MKNRLIAEAWALYMLSQMPNMYFPERMFFGGSGNPIFIPRHGKFKGYMRDNRNWGKKR